MDHLSRNLWRAPLNLEIGVFLELAKLNNNVVELILGQVNDHGHCITACIPPVDFQHHVDKDAEAIVTIDEKSVGLGVRGP